MILVNLLFVLWAIVLIVIHVAGEFKSPEVAMADLENRITVKSNMYKITGDARYLVSAMEATRQLRKLKGAN